MTRIAKQKPTTTKNPKQTNKQKQKKPPKKKKKKKPQTNNNNKSAYKSITFIIDIGNKDIRYANRTCNKHYNTKR